MSFRSARKRKNQKETESRRTRTDKVVLKTHSKIIRKSTFIRQVVLNLILDRNYILTGYV